MKTYNKIFAIFFVSVLLISCGGSESDSKSKDETTSKSEMKKDDVAESKLKEAKKKMNDNKHTNIAIAQIEAKSGSKVSGVVKFADNNGTVSMKAEITGLKPGNHAIHIHETGDCSADDGKSAGGHWNPTNVNHGKWGVDPFHVGDIGNINVGEDGIGRIQRTTDLWCINCDDVNKNIVGKAIIIHEGLDDFSSQPSGAAGPRVGCGSIDLK